MPVPYIIPFYKNKEQLDKCLAAIANQDGHAEPWVWDNNTNNLYYTKAENLGVKDAFKKGLEFAIVGTQDCYLQPGAVAALVQFMNDHPRCAHRRDVAVIQHRLVNPVAVQAVPGDAANIPHQRATPKIPRMRHSLLVEQCKQQRNQRNPCEQRPPARHRPR